MIIAVTARAFNPLHFLEIQSKKLRRLCPDGAERCHCSFKNGTYVSGRSLYYDEDPVAATLTYVTCNPDFCSCKGPEPEVEHDLRPIEFAAVMDLCPRGTMSRCLCHDNTVAKFPFDMETFLTNCRPKRVSAVIKLT